MRLFDANPTCLKSHVKIERKYIVMPTPGLQLKVITPDQQPTLVKRENILKQEAAYFFSSVHYL